MSPDMIRLVLEKATTLREAQDFLDRLAGISAPAAPPAPAPVAPVVSLAVRPEARPRKRGCNTLAKSGGRPWSAEHLAIVRQCKTVSDINAAAELFGRTPDAIRRQLLKMQSQPAEVAS